MSGQIIRIFVGDVERESAIAYPTPVPGLVINRDPSHSEFFNITHAGSGTAVATMIPDSELALHVAMKLAPVADWTRPATELRRSRSVRLERARVLHEIGPEYGTGRTVPMAALADVERGAS